MTDKKLPTAAEIDVLAQLYVGAQASVEHARQRESEYRDHITAMIEQFGSVPRRATKSKRLEGDEYQVTLSKGHSVEVNATRVELFRQWLKERGLAYLLRNLFRREYVFVAREHAQELVNATAARSKYQGIGANLSALFHQCLTIKDTSPSLKVEKRNDDKKKEAAA